MCEASIPVCSVLFQQKECATICYRGWITHFSSRAEIVTLTNGDSGQQSVRDYELHDKHMRTDA